MPSLWDTGKQIDTPGTISQWDNATPLVTATKTTTETAEQPTPDVWTKAKSTSANKPSWDSGVSIEAPKSTFQKVYEGVLGVGAATGEFDRMTTLGKALDLMGRPGYALKSLTLQMQQDSIQAMMDAGLTEEEIGNPLNPKRQAVLMKIRPSFKEKAKALWRGFNGEEKVTWNQLADNVGIRGVPFLGFAMEVSFDPLMWGSGAGYKAIGKGAKLATKPVLKIGELGYTQARKIPQVANAADFAIDKTNELGKATYDMFIAKSKIPELAEKVDGYLNKRKWLSGQGISFGAQTRDAIVKEAKLSGKKIDEVEKSIVSHIELPKASTATAGEREIARAIQGRLEKTFTGMTDAGVPISSLGMARRGKLDELYKSLEEAVGEKQLQILKEIDIHKTAIQDEILGLKASLKPLQIDVAHWSSNSNITEWRINSKTVINDLGTDFGTENAALARKQDISKGTTGKVYYTKISPRKTIDLTTQAEQLQYWDDPDAVLETIYKSNVITKPEYDLLKSTIPNPKDTKFHVSETVAQKGASKGKSVMVASPKNEVGLQSNINIYRKTTPLTDAEINNITKLHETKSAVIATDTPGLSLKLTWNEKNGRYNIYRIEEGRKTEGPVVQPQPGAFNSDTYFKAQNQWYSDFRRKLTDKGYDSIKYYALEDKITPTYKVLNSKIIDRVSKKELNQQERTTKLITKRETDVADLVNRAADIYHSPVTKEEIARTALKLKVNTAEAKEYAQIQKAREMGYFPRFTTKEAQAFLKDASRGRAMGASVWNPRTKNALERRTADFTIDEWNDFCKTNGLEELGGTKIQEYFMRDPAYATALYEVRAAKAITSAEFLQDTIKTFGKTGKAVPVGWVELPEDIIKLYPQAKGVVFDPEVVKEITRVTEHYINPAAAAPILQIFDGIQNMWRKWTLAPFPKYHLRNMVGNMWNNHLAGVDPATYDMAQAVQLWRKYGGKGGIKEKVAAFDLKRTKLAPEMADDIIASAEQHGVLGHGWYGSDVEIGIQQKLGKGSIVDRGVALGSTVENNARLAHYISKMQDGMTSAEAAASVKHYLFDYSDLTSFEREVMRRLFPFYTWSRKNIPLQFEQLMKQPEKFAPLTVPLRMRDEEDLVKLKYARPDIYERLPIEFRRTVDAVTYVPLEGLIPAGDIAKMVRPHELLFELLTPYIRVPMELYMDKSMYFKSEIEKYPQETQEVWRMDLPVKIKYIITNVLPQARLISEIDKVVRKQDKGQEELTPAEVAFSQSLSSIYKVDLKELRRRALSNISKDVEELRKGAATAHRKGREDEINRIKQTYKDVKQELKFIRGE